MTVPDFTEVLPEQIIAACGKASAKHGIRSFSMEHVAAEAGLSRETVYDYFVTRETLLGAWLRYGATRLALRAGSIVESSHDPAEGLREASRYVFDYLDKLPHLSTEERRREFVPEIVKRGPEVIVAAQEALSDVLSRRFDVDRTAALNAGEVMVRLTVSHLCTPPSKADPVVIAGRVADAGLGLLGAA